MLPPAPTSKIHKLPSYCNDSIDKIHGCVLQLPVAMELSNKLKEQNGECPILVAWTLHDLCVLTMNLPLCGFVCFPLNSPLNAGVRLFLFFLTIGIFRPRAAGSDAVSVRPSYSSRSDSSHRSSVQDVFKQFLEKNSDYLISQNRGKYENNRLNSTINTLFQDNRDKEIDAPDFLTLGLGTDFYSSQDTRTRE